jgi:hypothetical protein
MAGVPLEAGNYEEIKSNLFELEIFDKIRQYKGLYTYQINREEVVEDEEDPRHWRSEGDEGEGEAGAKTSECALSVQSLLPDERAKKKREGNWEYL